MGKKLSVMILAVLMACLMVLMIGCNEGKTPGTTTTDSPMDDNYPDYLRGKTFNGATVQLLVAAEALHEFFQEEDAEDNVDVAVYNRNLKVMDRHEVELKYVPEDGPTVMQNTMLALVQGGDQSYDVFAPSFWWQVGNEGIATNLADIAAFDFSQPWWYQGWNDALIYEGGEMYYCAGAVNQLEFFANTVVFLNRTLFDDVSAGYKNASVEDIQQLVLDGGWTKDVMYEYVKLFGSDLDFNNTYDENDAYGNIVTFASVNTQLHAWGVNLTYEKVGDDYEWNFFTKGFLEKYEAYGRFLNNIWTTTTSDWTAWPNEAFVSGRALFLTTPLNNVNSLRKGDVDYTILPQTKYSESQKEYRTMGYGGILNAIPGCIVEVDRAAVILEALNYESYYSIMPEIQETTLKYKVGQTDADRKILDLIYSTTSTNFAFVQGEYLKIGGVVLSGTNPNIASTYFKNEEMYNQLLNELLKNET